MRGTSRGGEGHRLLRVRTWSVYSRTCTCWFVFMVASDPQHPFRLRSAARHVPSTWLPPTPKNRYMSENSVTTLPDGIFQDLTAVTTL